MVSVYSVAALIVSSVCSVTALITGVSLFGGTGVLGDSGFLTSVFRLPSGRSNQSVYAHPL